MTRSKGSFGCLVAAGLVLSTILSGAVVVSASAPAGASTSSGWSAWNNLPQPPGGTDGPPAVASWGYNRLDIFVRGLDGDLWHAPSVNGGQTIAFWENLGAPPGGLTSAPAAVSWGQGRIDLFVAGKASPSSPVSSLWHRWFQGSWDGWENLGGGLSAAPAVSSWGPGRLDIFALGVDHSLWHLWWQDRWGPWEGLGGDFTSSPGATSWGPARIDVFADANGSISHFYWDTSRWVGPLHDVPGTWSSGVGAASWGVGRIDLFGQLPSCSAGHGWYQAPVGWGIESRGGCIIGPAGASSWGPDRVDAVATSPDGGIWHQDYDVDPLAVLAAGASAYAGGRAGIAGFSLVDTATGNAYSGGAALTPIRTASVIKVPIAMTLITDANNEHRGLTAGELSALDLMITQSDNNAATQLWNEVGGSNAVLGLMRQLGATDTYPDPTGAWGFTWTTSRDLSVVLAALARGVLGPGGTSLLLGLMRQVIPSERWGIGAAIPGAAIKNGWYPDPGDWRVNCLGVAGGDRYALAVMTEYPIGLGQGYGEITCQEIAAILLPGVTGGRRLPVPAAPPADAVPMLSGIGMTVDGG